MPRKDDAILWIEQTQGEGIGAGSARPVVSDGGIYREYDSGESGVVRISDVYYADAYPNILATTGSSTFDVILPLSTSNPYYTYYIQKEDAGTGEVHIVTSGSDTIGGVGTTKVLHLQGDSITVTNDGVSDWRVYSQADDRLLVSSSFIGAIGGRVVMGDVTQIAADLDPASTTLVVKRDAFDLGDIVYLESGDNVEFVRVASQKPQGRDPVTLTVPNSGFEQRSYDSIADSDWSLWRLAFRLSVGDDGYLYVRRNGDPVIEWDGPTCSDDDVGPTLSMGLYKPGWAGVGASDVSERCYYFDELKLEVQSVEEPETPGTPTETWWDPDTEGLSVWGAWQAKGAASLAQSYVDLSGNSHDLSAGVAPDWNNTTGWVFNGSTHYLNTGFTPDADQSQTLIVQFAGFTTGYSVQQVAAGCTNSGLGDENLSIQLAWTSTTYYGYRNGNYKTVGGGQRSAGNLCVAGAKGFYNGNLEVVDIGTWGDTPLNTVYIGGRNNDASLQYPAAVTIEAVAIYSGTLTDAQVATVAAAMANMAEQEPVGGSAELDYQVGHEHDDQEARTGTTNWVQYSSRHNTGNYTDAAYLSCDTLFRFTGVTIPAGATITEAHLECCVYSSTIGSPELRIYGVDADDPARPTSNATFVALALTTASVEWDKGAASWDGDAWIESPDIKTIIQELVDSYTYDGKALAIRVDDDLGSGSNLARFHSYEGDSSKAAKLHIEYTV
jgi:hypothetical protein